MEQIETRLNNGKQNPDYYKSYYLNNKERIARRFKKRYKRVMADPVLRNKHRKMATAATRRFRARYPEKIKATRISVYKNRKRRAMELAGGAKCIQCGCEVLEFLEINHKFGGGAKEFRDKRASIMDRVLSGKRKIHDLNILCRVCNALDHLRRKNSEAAKNYSIKFANHTGSNIEEIYASAKMKEEVRA